MRFRTIERIAEVARAHAVDAVVVAGNALADDHVSPAILRAAAGALRAFAPIPVLLLPGHRDAAGPDGVLGRLVPPGAADLAHVRVLLDAEPITVGGIVFHPCPLRLPLLPDDPTRDLPPRPPGDRAVRVVVAHGGVAGLGAREAVARIDAEAVLARGYDFLALGDALGVREVHPRAWYPGTPEPLDADETEAGKVLVVALPEAGAIPTVTPVEVAGTRRHEGRFALHGADDVAHLEAWLDAIEAPALARVRLHLSGALDVGARARLEARLERAARELLRLDVLDDHLHTQVDVAARLGAPGFLDEALRELLAHDDEAHRDAARLLVELLAEVRS